MSMKELKGMLRQEVKERLHTIKRPQYEHYSYQIAQRLYQDSSFQSAQHIGITISQYPEVDTYQIIRTCWEQGKTVSIPKCLPKTKQMQFYELQSFDQLEMVYSGIYEPIVDISSPTSGEKISLLIVPGLAFDRKGYRLGFGGGYYDRFLENYAGTIISLAFTKQLVECIPKEAHDKRVERIITNEGIIVDL